jgi:hypothetical protein
VAIFSSVMNVTSSSPLCNEYAATSIIIYFLCKCIEVHPPIDITCRYGCISISDYVVHFNLELIDNVAMNLYDLLSPQQSLSYGSPSLLSCREHTRCRWVMLAPFLDRCPRVRTEARVRRDEDSEE